MEPVEHFIESDSGSAPELVSVAEGALRQVIPADTALSLPTRGAAPRALKPRVEPCAASGGACRDPAAWRGRRRVMESRARARAVAPRAPLPRT